MIPTSFRPAVHGFQFSNNDIEWEVHPGGPRGKFLCGGMVYAALDFFYARQAVPQMASPPPKRTELHNYLYQRQIHAHTQTLPRLLNGKMFLSWLSPDSWFVDSLASEYDKLRALLAAGRPVPLFLVKSGVAAHHVVVRAGLSSPSLGNPILKIYDPNHPRLEGTITVDYRKKRFYNSEAATPSEFLGFFVDEGYFFTRPPRSTAPIPPAPNGAPAPPRLGRLPSEPSAPPPVPRPGRIPGPAPGPARHYIVRRGDSLNRIALNAYGDGNAWPRIYDANRRVIGQNPNRVFPGQVLLIP